MICHLVFYKFSVCCFVNTVGNKLKRIFLDGGSAFAENKQSLRCPSQDNHFQLTQWFR